MPRIGSTQPEKKHQRAQFARKLRELRLELGLSQSELAGKTFGYTETTKGYRVGRNRDRISQYEAGKAAPTDVNLKALADALNVTTEELAPFWAKEKVPSPDSVNPARDTGVVFRMLDGNPDTTQVRIDTILPLELASTLMKVVGLLERLRNADAGAEDTLDMETTVGREVELLTLELAKKTNPTDE